MQLIKNEELKITYSYWDGTGHRRTLTARKGDTIVQFLQKVKEQLHPDFREMRSAPLLLCMRFILAFSPERRLHAETCKLVCCIWLSTRPVTESPDHISIYPDVGAEKAGLWCRATSVSNLMYVKEDLIIPHHISFYDLITSKARGKSGPLFHFDVHEDIRLQNDARIEKDESHAGIILTSDGLPVASSSWGSWQRLGCRAW